MKLALMALAIEIGLARLLVGSWLWAGVIILFYCIYVYKKHVGLMKKQEKDNCKTVFEDTIIRGNINGNRKGKQVSYDIQRSLQVIQSN